MKKILIFFLVVSLTACSKEKSNGITLFNDLVFKMQEGEIVRGIDEAVKNNYLKYLDNPNIQIPLFKYIKHNDYEVFIGVPYNTSIKEIIDYQLKSTEGKDTSLYFKADSISYYKQCKKDELYIAAYASAIDSKSLLYIAAISASKSLSDSLFNQSQLSNRIATKNDQ